MITVKMVRDKGFEFVGRDVIERGGLFSAPLDNVEASWCNNLIEGVDDSKVIEFFPRRNTGSMPCCGELIVDIEYCESLIKHTETHPASDIDWEEDLEMTWKPSLANWRNEMNTDNIAVTTEEDEAFNAIDTTNAQFESLCKSDVVEWRNGDECVYMNHKAKQRFIGACPQRDGYCYIQDESYSVNFVEVSKLSKPETPQQREDRERLEAAYDLYCTVQHATGLEIAEFYEFKQNSIQMIASLAIVDRANYRVNKVD